VWGFYVLRIHVMLLGCEILVGISQMRSAFFAYLRHADWLRRLRMYFLNEKVFASSSGRFYKVLSKFRHLLMKIMMKEVVEMKWCGSEVRGGRRCWVVWSVDEWKKVLGT
jgi:hypothetical protein